jgi:hypothetical protein
VPDVPEASGYHDPVSSRFIAATTLVRKQLKVDSRCFERTSLAVTGQSRTTAAASLRSGSSPVRKRDAELEGASAIADD